MIRGKKILITGATGQVARPIAESFVRHNEVWCAARFSDPALRVEIECAGIKCFPWFLGGDDFHALPNDFNYVIHSACNIFPVADDYDAAISSNAEGTALLMAHCRSAESFLYISSLVIYKIPDDKRSLCQERQSPLGAHPPYAPSYSIIKVATESVVRGLACVFKTPVTIARLGVAYGSAGHGGIPAMTFRKMLAGETLQIPCESSYYSLISEEDIVAEVEPLLGAASVPATIVNWCGDDIVEERELYNYIAAISGFSPSIVTAENGGWGGAGLGDPTACNKIVRRRRMGWKEGVLRSLRKNFPDHMFKDIG